MTKEINLALDEWLELEYEITGLYKMRARLVSLFGKDNHKVLLEIIDLRIEAIKRRQAQRIRRLISEWDTD